MATTAFTISMTAPLDRLKADLGGATGIVASAAREMSRGMGSFASSVGGTIASLLTFRNVIGTALGTAGVGLLVKNAINAGDEIGEMALRVGLTTTALQEYQHAASTAGISSEKLETGLRILNERLTDAASGDEKIGGLFKSLNVAVTAGANIRDLESVLGDLAERFATMESPVQRASIATDLFGRAGTRMIPLLVKGRVGVQELREEASRLGVVLSGETIAQSDRAADSIQRLSNVISANLTKVLADLGPNIEEASRQLVDLIGKMQPFLQLFVSSENASAVTLSKRLATVTDEIEHLERVARGGIKGTMEGLWRGGILSTEQFQKAIAKLRNEQEQLGLLLSGKLTPKEKELPFSGAAIPKAFGQAQQNAIDEARRLLQSLGPDITDVEKKVLNLANRFDQLAESAKGGAGQVLALKAEALPLARAAAELEVWEKVRDSFEKSMPTFDAVAKEVAETRKQASDAAKEAPRYADAIHAQAEALILAKKSHDAFRVSMEAIVSAYDQATEAAQRHSTVEKDIANSFTDVGEAMRRHRVELDAMTQSTDAIRSSGGQGDTAGAILQKSLEDQISTLQRFRAEWREQLNVWAEGSDPFKELTRNIEGVTLEIGDLRTELSTTIETNRVATLAADFELINAQVRVTGDVVEGFTAKIARNREEIATLLSRRTVEDEATARALERQNDLLKQQATIVTFVGQTIESTMLVATDTIVDAFFRGEVAAIKWGDVVTNVLADIVKALIKVFIIETAIKALQGLASGFSFGGGAPITHAEGGIFTRPTFGIIGEAGPEAVIPLDRLRMGGGGGDVTVNVHPPSGTETRTQESSDSQGARTIDIFITKVVERGLAQGTFDRSLGSSFGLTRQGSRR